MVYGAVEGAKLDRFIVRRRGACWKPAHVVEPIRVLRGGTILETTDKVLHAAHRNAPTEAVVVPRNVATTPLGDSEKNEATSREERLNIDSKSSPRLPE